jgi:GNAT superfamily N-acetyltransferase
MRTAAFTIRFARVEDEADFRDLWAAYCSFSKVELPPSATKATWERIISTTAMHGLVASDDVSGELLGFAVFVVHAFSFSDRAACLVDDMYVRPDARGLGIGTQLLARLISLADAEGWAKVYWVADENNRAAREIFDRHFGASDGFVRYTVNRPRQAHAEARSPAARRYDGPSGQARAAGPEDGAQQSADRNTVPNSAEPSPSRSREAIQFPTDGSVFRRPFVCGLVTFIPEQMP